MLRFVPLKYIDPDGHQQADPQDGCVHDPETGECSYALYQEYEFSRTNDLSSPRYSEIIGVACTPSGECQVVSFAIPVFVAGPNATPGAAPINEPLGKSLSALGTALDLHATTVSGGYTIVQGLAAALAGPTGPDDALVAGGYYLLDPYENLVSWGAFFSTLGADFLTGSTQVDISSGEIIIGQDTMFVGANAIVGQFIGKIPVLGPSLDTAVNVGVNVYDVGRLAGIVPTYIEMRIDSQGPYFVIYR